MMIVSSPHLIRTQHRSPAFQSFAIRKPQIGYLIDFFRANRRTHNKSFTADNQSGLSEVAISAKELEKFVQRRFDEE
jgi:phosphatidylserine/phosphatidylglycerophosphate/cardiolipin synthase-like enzyme